jgi:hypothetical protein
MELFDIVKRIFDRKDSSWNEVSNNLKSRNFFMINRIMSIQYPIQANQFNHIKITPPGVVDWWRSNLSSRYTKSPPWIFTKTKKSESKKKTEDQNFSEVEDFVRNRFDVSKRDLMYLKNFYPDKYRDWLIDIADQIGEKTKIKKI